MSNPIHLTPAVSVEGVVYPDYFAEDVRRLVRVFHDRGFLVDGHDIAAVYSRWSSDLFGSDWNDMPYDNGVGDEYLFGVLRPLFTDAA